MSNDGEDRNRLSVYVPDKRGFSGQKHDKASYLTRKVNKKPSDDAVAGAVGISPVGIPCRQFVLQQRQTQKKVKFVFRDRYL